MYQVGRRKDWIGNTLWKKSESKPMLDIPEVKASGMKRGNMQMVKYLGIKISPRKNKLFCLSWLLSSKIKVNALNAFFKNLLYWW